MPEKPLGARSCSSEGGQALIAYFQISNSPESPGVLEALEQKIRGLRDFSPSAVAIVLHAARRSPEDSDLVKFVKLPLWPRQLITLMYPVAIWLQLKKMPRLDFLILRAGFPNPLMLFVFRRRTFKVITEHHTLLMPELSLLYSVPHVFLRFFYKFARHFNDPAVDAKLCVTEEIAREQAYSGPILVTGNLISRGVRTRPTGPLFGGNFLSVAMPISRHYPWHGEDRLIASARDWVEQNHQLRVEIWLLGVAGPSEKPHPRLDVRRSGKLSHESLVASLNSAHLGAASLALFRNGMSDAAPLKSRLFISQRIPFIYAYTDPDIGSDCSVALRLPNEATHIPWNSVKDFLEARSRGQDVEAWDKLQRELGGEHKIRKLVGFLRDL